jgi:hypothetical protein
LLGYGHWSGIEITSGEAKSIGPENPHLSCYIARTGPGPVIAFGNLSHAGLILTFWYSSMGLSVVASSQKTQRSGMTDDYAKMKFDRAIEVAL